MTAVYASNPTIPAGWDCSICYDNNPEGAVAHANGGEKHPTHKYCLLRWLENNSTCPNCRVPVDARPIVTLAERCRLFASRALQSAASSVRHPVGEIYTGVALLFAGHLTGIPLATATGFALQAHAVQRGITAAVIHHMPGTPLLKIWRAVTVTAGVYQVYQSNLFPSAPPPPPPGFFESLSATLFGAPPPPPTLLSSLSATLFGAPAPTPKGWF